MQTFGSIMQRHRGVGPGFDFLRLALSLCVVTFHGFQLPYGRGWSAPVALEAPIMLIVPAFFALSGYLVAGSMVRLNNVGAFLFFRALRIVPALSAEITLSALILGPAATTFALRDYFGDSAFAAYFLNILGLIHFHLPGVFLDNPIAGIVNGQLWTIPSELHCYIALAILMVLRLSTKPRLMLLAFLFLSLAECATALLPGHHYTARVLNSQEMLVLCFLCGNVFFLWRDSIPASPALFGASIAAYCIVTYWLPPLSFIVGSAAATYFIVYLGMHTLPRIPLLMSGDYSYGVYLYSFPIQQAVVWAFPDLRNWYWNLLIATPLALLFAAASWHWLEKPSLRLRRWMAPKKIIHPDERGVRPVPAGNAPIPAAPATRVSP